MLPDLAIAILFFEKTDQTIACVESFLASGCRIYILNNGSSTAAYSRFADWCSNHPQVLLLNAPNNLGVSAGRNLLASTTTSEWLLFVDNDIQLDTPELVPRLAAHIADWPDREVFIPRLYNVHDGCYAEFRSLRVDHTSAALVTPEDSCVNLFPGGASCIKRSLFERLGGYDEQIFIGHEDFELSLRALTRHEPVRALLISDIELRHSHLIDYSNTSDLATVLHRYDKETIRQSYELITTKYGVRVADQWEQWVDNQVLCITRHNRFGQGIAAARQPATALRIALVVDRRDWAFANIARHLTRRLAHRYAFDIYYAEDYTSDYDRLITDIYTNQYEIVHFFWREIILNLYIHILRSRLYQLDEITESFFNTRLTFSIYDHCLLEPDDLRNFQVVFKYLADGYVVSSERLQCIYRKIFDYPAPHRVIEDGVDLSDFYPCNTDRLLDTDRPVIVGWAGNSRWGMDLTTFDFKGFHSIIKPAIEELQSEGLAIEGRFADRNVAQIPYQEMVQYYNAIDIYLCASAIEGTPNPILESFACGVPVISTDVGIVPHLFGTEQKRFILNVRSKQELKDKLRLLVQTPALRKRLSEENLERIKQWTRDREADKWLDFFDQILAGQNETRRLLKRACLEVPYNYGIEATIDHFLKDSISWKLTRPLRWVNWHANRLLSMLKEKRASRR